ncbi:MAG TPA: AGE family epimerase/isomerase [Myxococcota bacterium]|nr:AGE family epimerase/isomerase [Myxococcota bacterium]
MRLTRAALRQHLVCELVPLWERHGLDRAQGGYWSQLRADRSPEPDGAKRLLVHARQLYAFSRASELGAGPWARGAAAHGLDFLVSRFWDRRHGGWFARLTAAGEPLDPRKDLYDHAFAIFALAEHHRITGEAEPLRLARETLGLVRARLREPKSGGFAEVASDAWRPVEGPRRQNPHMHLVEALLALHPVAPGDGALAEAAALVELLGSRWSDASGALGEHFLPDWRPAPGAAGERVEPGHGFEWFALLHRFAELGGDRRALERAERLFEFAELHGVDADGGVLDAVDRAGRPVETHKRLWPQTERVKALAVRARLGLESPARLDRALAYCAERHLDPEGGWHEHLSRDGRVVSSAQNATSVYHVVTALSEALRVGGGAS